MLNISKQIICIIIVSVIIICSFGFIGIRYFETKNQENVYAYVYSDEKLIEEINLTAVKEEYTFTVGDNENGFNIIKVMHNSIGIVDASCLDKVCVNTGFINSSMIPIVCLPNKVVIEIGTESKNKELFDAVTQ